MSSLSSGRVIKNIIFISTEAFGFSIEIQVKLQYFDSIFIYNTSNFTESQENKPDIYYKI